MKVAQDEAALAVRRYNDAAETRGFEGFVVHMHLAWLYLLHARFMRDGVDFRYRDRDNPRRFVKVDGGYKCWELSRCAEERWQDEADPVRNNLDFFIRLRNRIEHRHKKSDAELALAVSGHAQALLLNFEEEIVATCGDKYSLAHILRFPAFIGTFTDDGEKTLRRLRDKLPTDLKRFIAEFHSGLPDDTGSDPRFELRLRVVLERVVRDPEAPVDAVHALGRHDRRRERTRGEDGQTRADRDPRAEASRRRPRTTGCRRSCASGSRSDPLSIQHPPLPRRRTTQEHPSSRRCQRSTPGTNGRKVLPLR
ncbi:DUF3644 domain-containing protein [Kribbella solani]|uniref:DUF3644 domain-containing protein n=1 Tax=Kribbella solani TaxID=236067 RepID=A0A841DLB7_9ACTN|nr:DUF3644 domain-containing protein [Kribbella solani]MBB5979894.1 hypothetical protein [Kribbella solani]